MCCAVRDVPRMLMTRCLGMVVDPMLTMMMMMMMAIVVVMIKLVRLMWRELQLAPVGFPTETKRNIAEAVRSATRWDARRSAAEPRQDMATHAFLQYHTEGDWKRLSDASSIDGKLSVFVARAARIGLVHPADNYLRKVCVCVCARACLCELACCGA